MTTWEVREATLADRDAAVTLMNRAFGVDHRRGPLWDWAFRDNPFTDKLYYLVAAERDRLVAQYAGVPVRMEHCGKSGLGLLSMYTATDPDYQGRGLFRSLANELYDSVRDVCPIVFGFPNHRSAPILYKHLGWVDLKPYPHMRRPLRNSAQHAEAGVLTSFAGRALERLDSIGSGKNLRAAEIDDFAEVGDELWVGMTGDRRGTGIVRDSTFLNWRYVRSPFQYQRFAYFRSDQLVAISVVKTDNSDGKARLMEYLQDPTAGMSVSRFVLRHVARVASDAGAYGLGFVATTRHPTHDAAILSGFIPTSWSQRLHRSSQTGPTFGVRVNGSGLDERRLLDINSWYLSSGDQDWL